jgi:hypothetical protein
MFVSEKSALPEQKADVLHPELGLLYSEQSMDDNLLSNSVKKLQMYSSRKVGRPAEDGTIKMVRKRTVVNNDGPSPVSNAN